MRDQTKWLLVAIVALSFTTRTAWSIDLPTRFEAEEGFSFQLPERWVEMPSDVVEADIKPKLAAVSQFGTAPDYYFQLERGDEWLAPPYLLVFAERDFEIDVLDERLIEDLEKGYRRGVKLTLKNTPNTLEHEIKKIGYDSQTRVLMLTSTIKTLRTGGTTNLTAYKLVDDGFIVMEIVDIGQSPAGNKKVFKAMIDSLTLDEDYEYASTPSRGKTARQNRPSW